jgi:hypothetical protein
VPTRKWSIFDKFLRKNGGDDETRTRDLCRDRRFISTCNDLQEHGRHPKSLQGGLRHRYCVPRCVPPVPSSSYHVLIETQGWTWVRLHSRDFPARKNSLRSNSRGDLPQLRLWTVKGHISSFANLPGVCQPILRLIPDDQ